MLNVYTTAINPLNVTFAKLLLAALAVIFISLGMWGLNIYEMQWLNVIPFFAIGIAILMYGYSPAVLLTALGMGSLSAILDGNPQTTIGTGATSGIKILHRSVMTVLFGFWFVAGLLTLHPWHQNPSAFIALVVACVFILAMFQAFDVPQNKWWIVLPCLSYSLIVIVYAFATTIPNSWQGQVFDSTTGKSIYMMEPDGSHVFSDMTAQVCTEKKPCFSPYTGKKLVPATKEAATQNVLPRVSEALGETLNKVTAATSSSGTAIASWGSKQISSVSLGLVLIVLGVWFIWKEKKGAAFILLLGTILLASPLLIGWISSNYVSTAELTAADGLPIAGVNAAEDVLFIKRGTTKYVHVLGTIKVANYEDYCLDVGPKGAFTTKPLGSNNMLFEITPTSKIDTIATIQILYKTSCKAYIQNMQGALTEEEE